MRDYQSLSHTTWDCKYHVVFIPKMRKKAIFGAIRKHLGKVLHELAVQKGCQIVEGHLQPDHVHMYQHSTEARGIVCSRLYQGQECDLNSEEIHGPCQEFHG